VRREYALCRNTVPPSGILITFQIPYEWEALLAKTCGLWMWRRYYSLGPPKCAESMHLAATQFQRVEFWLPFKFHMSVRPWFTKKRPHPIICAKGYYRASQARRESALCRNTVPTSGILITFQIPYECEALLYKEAASSDYMCKGIL
jgi:hypothetical protein